MEGLLDFEGFFYFDSFSNSSLFFQLVEKVVIRLNFVVIIVILVVMMAIFVVIIGYFVVITV